MNCKPGDMAVVVKDRNIGLIVEVICTSETYGAPFWQVRPAWPAPGVFPDGKVKLVRVGSIHDARLRPIRPDARPDAKPDASAQDVDSPEAIDVAPEGALG